MKWNEKERKGKEKKKEDKMFIIKIIYLESAIEERGRSKDSMISIPVIKREGDEKRTTKIRRLQDDTTTTLSLGTLRGREWVTTRLTLGSGVLDSLLVFLDLGGNFDESFVDVGGVLGRGFDVGDLEVISELLGGFVGNLPLVFQIALVSNKKLVDVFARIPLNLLQPLLDVVVGNLVSNIKDNDDTVGTAVVRRGNGPETLLTSGIPNLQLDGLTVELNGPHLEIHTNGGDVGLGVGVISKTKEQTVMIGKQQ